MRSLLLRAGFALAVVGVPLLACGFPDLSFGPDASTDDDIVTDAGPTATARIDAAAATSTVTIASSGPTSAPKVTAAPTGTVTSAPTSTATATAALVCDQDRDGVLKGGAACAPPDGGQADCDDTDARINPNADFIAGSWPPASPHLPANDWNCDGTVTKQLPSGITCAALGDCTEGFATDIDCGATATYNVCKKVVPLLGAVLCAVDHTETRTQGCR